MFLSEQMRKKRETEDSGTLEMISLGGETSTVASSGNQSLRTVYAPGGMCWIPRRGQGVLVIKAGMEDCIAGAEMEQTAGMEPGEVKIYSQAASLWLKNDGSILLEGRVLVNGKELEI